MRSILHISPIQLRRRLAWHQLATKALVRARPGSAPIVDGDALGDRGFLGNREVSVFTGGRRCLVLDENELGRHASIVGVCWIRRV